MGAERVAGRSLLRSLLAGAIALGLGGCVSSSIERDLTRVRELARAETLPELRDDELDPDPDRETTALSSEPLDVETAVRVALLRNRTLRAQLRALGVARAALMQAATIANPVVGAELPAEREADLELHVEYEISSLLVASRRADAAEAELQRARLDAAAATVGLGHEVRAAFFSLQAAEQRLGIAQRTLDTRAAARDASRALQEAGNARALDTARQIAAYERARIGVAELELERARARERLVRLLSVHGPNAALRTAGTLGEAPAALPTLDRIETRAIEASLELRAARAALEAHAHRSGAARTAGLLPDVTLDATARHAADDSEEVLEGEDPWSFGAGVSVELPLFDRAQGATRASEAAFDAELERYHGVAVEVRSAAREAAAGLESAAARARQFATVILPAQREVLAQTLLQYNAMQIGIYDLLRAQTELLDAELAHVEVLREYWTARATVDALLRGHRVGATGHTAAAAAGATLPAAAEAGGH
jgi:cobalt-zinc-cadmium efflux system outer membrane protein